SLIAQKNDIVGKLDRAILFDPFDLLEALEPDINLLPSERIQQHDTLYTANIYNPITQRITPYRMLSSNVVIRGRHYVIQLKSSLVNNEDLIQSIVLVEVILLVLIGTGLVLINRRLSRQIWDPFYKSLEKLRNYKVESDDPVHFENTGIYEFNDLNKTIHDLTERNKQVYMSQKEFTENASHEMQTPLAVLQTKLELLMQTEPITEEQASIISSLNDTSSRLSRLNRSLLLLTKIENKQYQDTESVQVDAVCDKVIELLASHAALKEISFQKEYKSLAIVQVNRSLFEILVSNLLTNAIRYNYKGGVINVKVDEKTLIIENTGTDHVPDKDKIFDRFHKEGTNSQSIGLGLAIVKRICALYNFTIAYDYINNLHTFTVHF
ncbi:MAG TPA: HAMP domain-containing sensor histidine kinase, partial [Flavisolibacter sp.]|nr:HAMP domain-containing sensor histidine kinase [Flavisolibacter sp.]